VTTQRDALKEAIERQKLWQEKIAKAKKKGKEEEKGKKEEG